MAARIVEPRQLGELATHGDRPLHRRGLERLVGELVLAQPHHLLLLGDGLDGVVGQDAHQQQADRVGAQVDERDDLAGGGGGSGGSDGDPRGGCRTFGGRAGDGLGEHAGGGIVHRGSSIRRVVCRERPFGRPLRPGSVNGLIIGDGRRDAEDGGRSLRRKGFEITARASESFMCNKRNKRKRCGISVTARAAHTPRSRDLRYSVCGVAALRTGRRRYRAPRRPGGTRSDVPAPPSVSHSSGASRRRGFAMKRGCVPRSTAKPRPSGRPGRRDAASSVAPVALLRALPASLPRACPSRPNSEAS